MEEHFFSTNRGMENPTSMDDIKSIMKEHFDNFRTRRVTHSSMGSRKSIFDEPFGGRRRMQCFQRSRRFFLPRSLMSPTSVIRDPFTDKL